MFHVCVRGVLWQMDQMPSGDLPKAGPSARLPLLRLEDVCYSGAVRLLIPPPAGPCSWWRALTVCVRVFRWALVEQQSGAKREIQEVSNVLLKWNIYVRRDECRSS